MRKVVYAASIAVLIFDALASIVSRTFEVRYYYFSFGSLIIYFLAGAYTAKTGRLRDAFINLMLIGLVDASIGWLITGFIKPFQTGNPKPESIVEFLLIAAFVMAIAVVVGGAGYLVKRLTNKKR
ncbi:MAG: hypothetical protein JNM09_17105 [Blastocatellia bacterium]|nr:hypothetical protein [Blastocatellia bacterium]